MWVHDLLPLLTSVGLERLSTQMPCGPVRRLRDAPEPHAQHRREGALISHSACVRVCVCCVPVARMLALAVPYTACSNKSRQCCGNVKMDVA